MPKQLNLLFRSKLKHARSGSLLTGLLVVAWAGLSLLLPTDKLLAQEQLLLPPGSSQVASLTPKAALERFFTTEPKNYRAEWFAPNFKLQGSNTEVAPGVASYISQLTSQLGPYKGIEQRGQELIVGLNRGSVPAQIQINPQGQITKLAFPKMDFPASSHAALPSGKAYR
jgi:hypothetical protein